MKRILSVSLGSSKRDHTTSIELSGQTVTLIRKGVDGDLARARKMIREMDGQVDGFGLGGIDRYVRTRAKVFTFRDAENLAKEAKITPIADGSGLKNSIERNLIHWIDKNVYQLNGKSVLLVSSVDRFGMAEELTRIGAQVIFGDLMFGLGIPIPIRSLNSLERFAHALLPVLTRLPFHWVYPTGDKQEQHLGRFASYFLDTHVIAGDWHYIHRDLPERLEGKIVITNTLTAGDIEKLKRRGVSRLIPTTPILNGRSFGANVIEALALSFAKKRADEMTAQDYEYWIEKFGFRPQVVDLN